MKCRKWNTPLPIDFRSENLFKERQFNRDLKINSKEIETSIVI